MKAALRSIKMKSFLAAFVVLVIFCESNDCFAVKKSASPERNSENVDSGMDKILVNYDEYPVSALFAIYRLTATQEKCQDQLWPSRESRNWLNGTNNRYKYRRSFRIRRNIFFSDGVKTLYRFVALRRNLLENRLTPNSPIEIVTMNPNGPHFPSAALQANTINAHRFLLFVPRSKLLVIAQLYLAKLNAVKY